MAQTYTTVAGDTLSSIAQHVYGDADRWPEIYAANRAVIGNDPGQLAEGKTLTIPDGDGGNAWNWYTAQPGDTLFDIGVRVSNGDQTYWRVLYNSNLDIIGTDPSALKAGTRIRIPNGSPTPPQPVESWQRIGGAIAGDPAGVFYRDGMAHVFASSANGTVTHFFDTTWQDLGAAPAGITESPGAAVRGDVNIHIGVRGSDTHFYHRFWNGNQWLNWEQRGGDLRSGPALASWGAGRLDVFATNMFQQLIHCAWDVSGGWTQWEDLSQTLPTQFAIQYTPAVAAWGPNRLDVVAVKAGDGHLLHCWWDGTRWNGWEDLGGILNATPAIVAGGVNQLLIYGRGTDGQTYENRWNGIAWTGWRGLGGDALASAITAVVGESSITLFARGTDNALWQRNVAYS